MQAMHDILYYKTNLSQVCVDKVLLTKNLLLYLPVRMFGFPNLIKCEVTKPKTPFLGYLFKVFWLQRIILLEISMSYVY